jgi:hypothetical protein
MATYANALYQVLYAANPKSIGGALPMTPSIIPGFRRAQQKPTENPVF